MDGHHKLGAHHPGFGWHFVPGLKARVQHEGGGYLVRVNETGFRSDWEFDTCKPPGVFRVLMFGDSFTAGSGVSNHARYSDVLTTLIPNLQVYNFAVPGSGTDEQYLIYDSVAREFEHDLIIISVWLGGTDRIMCSLRAIGDGGDSGPVHREGIWSVRSQGRVHWMHKAYFTLGDDGALELHNVPVPREPARTDEISRAREDVRPPGLAARAKRKVLSVAAVEHALRYARGLAGLDPLPLLKRGDNPTWRLLRAILARWTAESTVPAIVMPIPVQHHIERTLSARSYQRRFATLARPPKVVVHDPLPDLLAYPLGDRKAFRFEHDLHPTPMYHRALAESLVSPVVAMMTEHDLISL